MTVYSHSKLATFEQCKLKFRLKYIDKVQPDMEQTIEGFLGSKVHDALEWLYTEIRYRDITLDDLLSYYLTSWKTELTQDIYIVNKENTPEHYCNKGIRFLINYFTTHTPFKDNTIATEKHIKISLDDDEQYIIQGYIDRLVHYPETNVFEIHDYKTSQTLKSQEELDEDRQLALYAFGIHKLFPEATEVRLTWHFLDFNVAKISQRTKEDLEKLRKNIIALIQTIENTTEFPPTPSALCKWCEFRSHCPTMRDATFD